jgi:hypothetical protein
LPRINLGGGQGAVPGEEQWAQSGGDRVTSF